MIFPKVSVLLPVYNASIYIEETIKSVLNQSYSDFELVIVDNCSTDNTFDLLSKYTYDDRVRIFKNETNVGMIRNWNECILRSSGYYLKYLFSDDLFEPTLLEEYVKAMETHPDVSLVFSPRKRIHPDGRIEIFNPYFTGKRDGNSVYNEVLNLFTNPIGEPTLVMFKRKHLNLGLFNVDLYWLADIDFWLRLCTVGNVYGLEKACTLYRISDTQQTSLLIKAGKTFKEERDFIYYNSFIRGNTIKGDSQKFVQMVEKHFSINIEKIEHFKYLDFLDIILILRLKLKTLKFRLLKK